MPVDFRETRLWKAAFQSRKESAEQKHARSRLQQYYLDLRDRADLLVKLIPKDIPFLTVHDLTHADALWELADLVTGPEISITPTEGFVLGGAFLLHDAAMSLAAYPNGLMDLRKHTKWRDAVAILLASQPQRSSLNEDLGQIPLSIEMQAVEFLLRDLHAEQASRLPTIEWKRSDGTRYYLIENADLRNTLGPIVGRVSYSHWWPAQQLIQEFKDSAGAPNAFPHAWKIDSLKLACILRLADAAHLDWRRAPGFLRALLKPTGVASEHWTFQEHLNQPYLLDERMVYTANRAFPQKESRAWWLCYDSLRMVDSELATIDALLNDLGKQRFAAKAVKGISDPKRLSELIPTESWSPVQAQLTVSDVAALVGRLGGEELYGRDKSVPIRELIQNSSDAIRARRVLERRPADWGNLIVRKGKDDSSPWLEIQDDGIGMSERVLTGPFLDFGKSFWGTQLMVSELPGLAGSGFAPTGRYGIGFFSAFMLGARIKVTTRRFDEAPKSTRVLEFQSGVGERPVLRTAELTEHLRDGGTVVRIWLDREPMTEGGFQWLVDNDGAGSAVSLNKLVSWLCPAVDVNILVESSESDTTILPKANDWLTNSGSIFLERLWPLGHSSHEFRERLGTIVREIRDNYGRVLGRGCITPREIFFGLHTHGVISVGGFRAAGLSGIAGIFSGIPVTASRDRAELVIPPEALAAWATEQAILVKEVFSDPEDLATCAATIALCGGDPRSLPLIQWNKNWLTGKELSESKGLPAKILVIDRMDLEKLKTIYPDLKLARNVMIQPLVTIMSIYSDDENRYFGNVPRRLGAGSEWAQDTILKQALLKAWDVPVIHKRSIDNAVVGKSRFGDALSDAHEFTAEEPDDTEFDDWDF